jgi:hypothetical protein
MSWLRRRFGGQIFWTSLLFESMHLASQNAIGQARLIIGHRRVVRIDSEPLSPPLEMWDWARCCQLLPKLASNLFATHSKDIATEFLEMPALPFKPIYTPSTPPPAFG